MKPTVLDDAGDADFILGLRRYRRKNSFSQRPWPGELQPVTSGIAFA